MQPFNTKNRENLAPTLSVKWSVKELKGYNKLWEAKGILLENPIKLAIFISEVDPCEPIRQLAPFLKEE
jgi:hypothetical protein